MARLIHLSDLHFGAHDPELVRGVERKIDEAGPDLVVISGDFTQRARTDEFQDACRFLERLRDAGHEVLAVPGNHDVPLYDVFRRFLSPLTRYQRYIDDTLCPLHEIPGATVLGINTARSFTFSDGRINEEHMRFIREAFDRSDPDAARVLVTHHPLFAFEGAGGPRAAGRGGQALNVIAEARVDMLLAGHNHESAIRSARDLVTRAGPALVVQAGTATSVRLRGQDQSFNRIEIDPPAVTVVVETWNGSEFNAEDAQPYERQGDYWRIVETAGETTD